MAQNETIEAFEALKAYMKETRKGKLVSGGKEILKRCHICGDSRDSSKAHMYIGIRNGLLMYNCFKCNSGGVVDAKFLKDIEIEDDRIINVCQEHNSKVIETNSAQFGQLGRGIKQRHPLIPLSNNEFAQKKLSYISNRMGHLFNTNDAAKFKIILNLKDFLDINGIEKYTRHPDMIDLIDKFFVGFLSMDNRYVMLRRLVPEGKLPEFIDYRYINYDILGSGDDAMKYYIIPNIINLDRPLDIHIAEGAFDILSIYLHVAPMGANAVYAAIGGKSYFNLIKFFIMQYGFLGFNLHIYPDADIDDREFRRIKEILQPFNIPIWIHRNRADGQKDYGVRMDQIIDRKYKL